MITNHHPELTEVGRRASSDRVDIPKTVDDGATFDYIVCGAGSSGSVVAGRLAADPAVTVLLIESGGGDDDERVRDPDLWPTNLGSERTGNHATEPNPQLNGRRLAYATGRGLGGGGAVNACVWARGHRSDWDSFAAAAGDPAWGYAHVLERYRRIEDWQGAPDPWRRGVGGPMQIQSAQDVHPLFSAFLDGAESAGATRYDSANGELMEASSGCAVREENIHDGVRQSPFRRYVGDRAGRPSLTVLPHTTVSRVLLTAGRAVGVEVVRGGRTLRARASAEVVLSQGAIGTPAVLLRSDPSPPERWPPRPPGRRRSSCSCATPRRRTGTSAGPPGWDGTTAPSWTLGCRCTGSKGSASPMPRCCLT